MALQSAGLNADDLAFYPKNALKYVARESRVAACAIAEQVVSEPDITAVVAANDLAALGLLDALQQAHIPLEQWPAVVGFDNLPAAQGQVLTSLHLPAEGIARAAADILWERRNGVLTGVPVHRHVAMSLLPRLTSRAGWSAMMNVRTTAF
jgi:LacI family transcriptional regulator